MLYCYDICIRFVQGIIKQHSHVKKYGALGLGLLDTRWDKGVI